MAYSSEAVSLSDAAELVAESLGRESSREEERLRHRLLIREARYELIRALRDGAIESEGEHIIASNDGLPRIEIRKVSRVWWAQAVVEPPRHTNLWKPGHIYVMWSGDGALVIGPGCSPPPAGHVIDGATAVRRIRLEREALLAIWPIAELSREQTNHFAVAAAGPGEIKKPGPNDQIAINSVDGQIFIQALPGEGVCVVPFVIDDVHNLYEWSMVLGDLHPSRPLGAVGTAQEGREDLRKEAIELFSRPQAIFNAIVATYKSGKIKPFLAWDEKPPDDLTLLRFRREDILGVMSDLGADGIIIGMLAAEREKQIDSQTAGAPATADDPAGTRDRQANGETPAAPRRQHGPTPTADNIKEAGQTLIDEGYVPAETVPWKQFEMMLCQKLRIEPGARGYSLDSIQNALRPLLQKRQAAKLSSESTESTES
jgi:hypothetical protein